MSFMWRLINWVQTKRFGPLKDFLVVEVDSPPITIHRKGKFYFFQEARKERKRPRAKEALVVEKGWALMKPPEGSDIFRVGMFTTATTEEEFQVWIAREILFGQFTEVYFPTQIVTAKDVGAPSVKAD